MLSGYIVREVLKGSTLAAILLLTLFNLFTFSDELKDIGTGNYQIKQIFLYLILTSPRVFYELIPSAALLGSLFVVGAMSNNRELVAMRAAGYSVFWVIKSVMLAGLILVLISLFVGEFVAPKAERTAQLIRATAQNDKVILNSESGLWLREGNSYINVRKIEGKGKLANIYIYEFDEQNHLMLMSQVEKASFKDNELWEMENIVQSEVSSKQIFANMKDQMVWKTSIDPDLLNVVVVKSENMSLYDLYMYISFLKENNQKSQTFELAFWSRLINPLVTFVMLMVSIPFVISVNRGVGTGGRLLLGVIIGLSFNIFDKIAGHLGLVYEFNPMLMAVLPSLIVFFCAVIAVSRTG